MSNALKNDFEQTEQPQELSTNFRLTKVSYEDSMILKDYAKLVARKSSEGLYAIRKQAYGESSEGHGYSDPNSFSKVGIIQDFLSGYEDYRFTLEQVEDVFTKFNNMYPIEKYPAENQQKIKEVLPQKTYG